MAMRAFISIDLDPRIIDAIKPFQAGIEATKAQMTPVKPAQMHISLKFLGEIGDEQAAKVSAMLDGLGGGPFDVPISGTGAFPSRNFVRVVWVGAQCDRLDALADRLLDELEKLGFAREEFTGHVTVARIKNVTDRKKLSEVLDEWATKEFGVQKATAIRLKKSTLTPQGPIYETVHEAKL